MKNIDFEKLHKESLNEFLSDIVSDDETQLLHIENISIIASKIAKIMIEKYHQEVAE